MIQFSAALKELRQRLGYPQAKGFYQKLAADGLSCNYQHYMKIEKGNVTPTPDLVSEIAAGVSPEHSERLIQIYCANLFPKFRHIFQVDEAYKPSPKSNDPKKRHQKTLNHRQVHALSQSRAHYYLFLVLTLARTSLSQTQLRERLTNEFKSMELMTDALEELKSANLIHYPQPQSVQASITDIRFPARTETLAKSYEAMDDWDKTFGEAMEFSNVLQKAITRRISVRYLDILERQMNLFVDLIKSSDELDSRFNNEVVQLKLSFKKGRLPG